MSNKHRCKTMNKKPILISFSGGRTSAYMTYLLTHTHLINDFEPHIVFANTGCEHPKTLDFVENCAKHFNWKIIWLEANVTHVAGVGTTYTEVDYATASINGEPYEEVIKKYGVPCVAAPHCTRELKLAPIRAWCRNNFGTAIIDTAIGIRADETRRINHENMVKNKLHYPLVDLGIDKEDVLEFWKNQPFDLDLPEHLGNCVWCFKKSDTKLVKALNEYPIAFEFPSRIERDYPVTKQGKPSRIFRKNRTVDDLKALAGIMGDVPDQMITEGGCSESCEFISALEYDL